MTEQRRSSSDDQQTEGRGGRIRWRRLARWTILGSLVIFVAMQLVPYGRDHSNPPVTNTVQWDSPETAALFNDACMDCHSHQTEWPWYSNVAPMSWLLQRDVEEGRDEFNISGRAGLDDATDAAETVQEGSMPPRSYTLAHPEARLSNEERQDLIEGLIATFGED